MSATDELRRQLDERGVKYRFNDATKVFEWHFDGTDGEGSAHATEVAGGINIIACSLTPAQAIAATLGSQIVRCKDCKHFTHNKEFWIEPPKVPFPMIGATIDCCDFWADTECKVEPDGFCAWGERKVVEQ